MIAAIDSRTLTGTIVHAAGGRGRGRDPRGSTKRGSTGHIDFISPLPCRSATARCPLTWDSKGICWMLVLGPRLRVGTRVQVPAWGAVILMDRGMTDDKLVCSSRPRTNANGGKCCASSTSMRGARAAEPVASPAGTQCVRGGAMQRGTRPRPPARHGWHGPRSASELLVDPLVGGKRQNSTNVSLLTRSAKIFAASSCRPNASPAVPDLRHLFRDHPGDHFLGHLAAVVGLPFGERIHHTCERDLGSRCVFIRLKIGPRPARPATRRCIGSRR